MQVFFYCFAFGNYGRRENPYEKEKEIYEIENLFEMEAKRTEGRKMGEIFINLIMIMRGLHHESANTEPAAL
jgi:hypothetical protein